MVGSMRQGFAAGVALLVAPASASAAPPACKLSKFLDLPVLLTGRRPIVTTTIAGKEARFIIDSGAFFSTMSQASAAEYGLRLEPAPVGFRLRGINGDTTVSVAKVHDFGIAGVTVPRLDFLVGGTDMGSVGVLGQNLLGIGDVEYDLPHGSIRLLHAENCPVDALAYWAGAKPFTIVPIEPRNPPFKVHTVATVTLNGVKLRAVFDTGAQTSIMTTAAAKRAGVTPTAPGSSPPGNRSGSAAARSERGSAASTESRSAARRSRARNCASATCRSATATC